MHPAEKLAGLCDMAVIESSGITVLHVERVIFMKTAGSVSIMIKLCTVTVFLVQGLNMESTCLSSWRT